MANLFIEGWENFPTGALNGVSGALWEIDAISNRMAGTSSSITGARSVTLTGGSSSGSGEARRVITPSSNELYFGFAVIVSAHITSQGRRGIGVRGTSNFVVSLDENGTISAWRSASLLSRTSLGVISTGVKYYIEVHLTETTYEVLLDGNPVLSGTFTSIGDFQIFYLSSELRGSNFVLDDLYVNDVSGSVNNGYLGELSVVPLMPDTDESPQDWSLSSGSDAYSLLANRAPSDTDYIEAGNADDEAAFSFETIPFPVTEIFAVQPQYRAEKSSSGESAVQLSLTHGSTTVAGEENFTAESTYEDFRDVWELDPDTGEPWSPDTFDPKVTLKRTV